MKNLVVLALDGIMDSSLAITLDTLRTGQGFLARQGKSKAVNIQVAAHGKTVRTQGNMRMRADLRFSDVVKTAKPPDWVIVPGLGLVNDAQITARLLLKDAQHAMALLRSLPDSVQIAAGCSAVFLLGQSGVLQSHLVTTTWWLAQQFRSRYADIQLDETRMLARDGRFLTAGSAFAQLDLSLAIVAETMGLNVAQMCSRYMLIDQRPSQARYMVQSHSRQVDPIVVAAERWIDQHIAKAITVVDLAANLAVTPKTLARHIATATGDSTLKFIQKRKILQASHLIETTALSIDAVAEQVGYQDGTALRKLIKREFGVTPGALRVR